MTRLIAQSKSTRRDSGWTAQAATLAAPGRFEIQEISGGEPGPKQALVRMQSCGVCASSLPVWQGRPWFEYPLAAGAPGHEGCGVIEAVGDDVEDLQVGQRVAALSHHAFAAREVVDADCLAPLPEALDGRPFPGEAIGCAMNIFRRSGVGAGPAAGQQTVAIVGAGFLGGLLTQLCARAGATVFAVSRRRFSLEVARQMGAAAGIEAGEHHDTVRRATEAAEGAFDVVIECTGVQAPLDLASALVRERGRLVVAGFHQDGPRTVDMQSWNWRGIDVINAHERDPAVYVRGIAEGAAAVAAGTLDPDPLYTHRFELERIEEAFAAAAERPDGFVKAIVMMEEA